MRVRFGVERVVSVLTRNRFAIRKIGRGLVHVQQHPSPEDERRPTLLLWRRSWSAPRFALSAGCSKGLDLRQLRMKAAAPFRFGLTPVDSRAPPRADPVAARDDMEDSDGANFVTDVADAAGNVVVIELDNGLFVVLAHLRQGTVQVSEGDLVREGDPLALLGNSGNTTMPHLHLQVQTHVDLWDPDNRSVPFAFEAEGHVLARNDRVEGRDRS